MEQPDREISPGVAELMKAIAFQQEDAVFLPLHRLPPGFSRSPNAGQTSSFDDVDHFVDGQLEGRQGLSGRNLTNPGLDDSFLPHELDESSFTTPVLPPG